MPKRLYRSKTNRVIAGVCGGLGEYFGIDPIIFRILFLFIFPLFWIYFILWIFVAENPSQRASTKGTAFWKILLIILFFLLPIIFGLVFFAGSLKFINSATQSPYSKNQDMSAEELSKSATSKIQEYIQLQNKGNLTDVENKRKINLLTEALSEYNQATEKDPLYIDAWQSLAVLNHKIGDAATSGSPEQVTLYNEAANAYYNLGQVYLQKGQKDQAKTTLETGLKIVPSSNTALKTKIQQSLSSI